MVKEYLTVFKECENTTLIERSKFICVIKGVNGEDEAREFIEKIKKEHPFATHSCYAYIADEEGKKQKFSDDGEPQGTAGVPIIEVLKNRKIFKVVAVVIRYFGGIKLGAGGLVRAYSGAVSDCLDLCEIKTVCAVKNYVINTDYSGYPKVLKLCSDDVVITKTDFMDGVKVNISVKTDCVKMFEDKIKDAFSGKVGMICEGEGFLPFK